VGARVTPLPPQEVVKANTAAAFDAFYSFDDYIATSYLDRARLELYDLTAAACAAVVPAAGPLRVMDVGCGTGHALAAVVRWLPGRTLMLHGLDFSAVAVGRARALLPGGVFVAADLYDTPLPGGAYDLVLCLETLEHVADPELALAKLLYLCAPGGHVVLTVPNGDLDRWDGHRSFWSPAALAAWLRPHGLVRLDRLQDNTALLAVLAKAAA
jgi:2-polyprenyl-3-methyl-5-hydroxy-6-metoxy-1,4-benzoquinol methylase